MPVMRKITIEVPEYLAREIEARVSAGVYESESAFVIDSLSASLVDNTPGEGPAIERWIRDQVMPTIERIEREGFAGLTSEQVFGGLEERYLARTRVE